MDDLIFQAFSSHIIFPKYIKVNVPVVMLLNVVKVRVTIQNVILGTIIMSYYKAEIVIFVSRSLFIGDFLSLR